MADKKSAYEYFLDALSEYPELPDTNTYEDTTQDKSSSAYENLLASLSDLPELPENANDIEQPFLKDYILNNLEEVKTIGGATGTVVDDLARPVATAIQAVKDGITNAFSSEVETGSGYDLSENEQAIYSVAQNVGRWGITGALAYGSAMTGGLASVGLGALSKASLLADTVAGSREVYKGIYEDALSRGLSQEDASSSAAWGTAMSMPLEFISDAYMAKIFGKANAKRIERKLIASGAVERIEDKNAIKVLNNEVAESIFQEELPAVEDAIGFSKFKDGLPNKETLNKLKGALPDKETFNKIKQALPDKETFNKLKDALPDKETIANLKNKLPTKESLEGLKKYVSKEEFDKIKNLITNRAEWNKIKSALTNKEDWEKLKATLSNVEWNKIKNAIPDKETLAKLKESLPEVEWNKIKDYIPNKETFDKLKNLIPTEEIKQSINRGKTVALDKLAEVRAARQAAQKANLHIKNPELYNKIIKEAEAGRNWRELAESVTTEMATEGVQGRLENLGTYMHDPNMTLSEVFEGTAQDMLLGGIGAGVLHGIAKGIGKSPIGKFSAKRIAEMHRRRFDMGDVFNDLSTSKDLIISDKQPVQRDFQDDFYKAHYVFDADTGERVDWGNIQDDGHYNITYQDGYAARNVSGKQVKAYAQKVVGLRVNPETNDVVIPADIEYEGATGTLTISENGTTTITPNYQKLSEDPVKAEEQAVEQTEQTRATIMKDQGIPQEQVERQSPMPGAANQPTFGRLSEGSEIQNDVTDKPDIVEDEDEETSDFIAIKIDREAEKIVSNYKNNKPQKGLVSKNHVLSTIVKFAKKALDINLDTTLKTEGRFEKGKPVPLDTDPTKPQKLGQTEWGKSIVRIRDASDGKTALHELGHYLFNRGKRLQNIGFNSFIGKSKGVSKKGFEIEMNNLWNTVLNPGTNPANENPATTTRDEWTDNTSKLDLSEYSDEKKAQEIFVETFARYVANQGNFREQFKKAAPATYKAFQQYLTDRKLHDDIEKIRIVWDKYASQDARTRGAADSSNQRPTRYQKLYDYIQRFIGDRQHLANILSKTIDNLAGFRRIMKELGDKTYKASDRFERIRGQSLSAVQAFISGKGLRWGGSDLFGTRFRNYDSIISDVQKLKAITDSEGNTVTGVQRFDAYLAAKNTVGETIGNTKTMRNVEAMARDLGQTVRQTQADIIDIKRNANYDWSNSKYAPFRRFIEERVRSEGQWIQTQETLAQAWNIIEDEEKQADFDRLQKAFNDYQYLWNSVQNYVSAMSPSMEAYIKAMRIGGAAYYTPLMREILQNSEKYNAVITQREGSDRPAYSSLENTPAEISALIDAGLRAYTKDMLVKMAAMPDSGVYIQEVIQPEKALNMVKIKEAIKEATLKTLPPGTQLPQDLLDALELITVGTIYIADPEADLTGNVFSVVTVNSAGKADLKFFKADDALLTMLETHNDTDGTMNQVLELLDYFNRFQKDWFTRYSLRFVLYKNQFRDAFSASFKGNRLLFKTGNKYIDNNWLNSIAGSLQGMASVYMMWITNPNQWEQYEDAMAAIGMSTNKIQNEYNAILSRTKPSVAVPQGAIGFLTSPKFKKFLQRMDQSDLIVRISELEYLLKDLGVDKEELYLSKDRVCALALSKNKLESIGLKYDMIEQILTNDQRTMWNNTNSAATLTLNLTPGQIQQIQHIVETNNVRTQRSLTEDQIDMLNREVALCTTDFLRRGKWSDKLNRYMLFSKAGINGTAQYGTWVDRRKMQGRSGEVYGRIVSAAISGWLLTSLFGDDDEDEEEMWNGIRLRFGDATIDIPALPEDLLGWNMGRALAHGDVNGTFVKHFAASINPIKSAGFAGLVADVLSDKKLSRVGWDDFAEPIVPPYLKQKYGDELDKIVTYNTGVVARALPNIFGMTPAHWQYVLNNMGIGRLVKAVETAAGVDKSVLLPDGSVIPTGQGSLNYVVQQAGINRPLYRTRYERQLDELFKEATTEYSMSPDDEDAKAKYLLLYNATHLQQNLNKLRFYATTPDQQKRLIALTGATAKNSLEAITGGDADLYKLRAANKSAKAALETTQAQLKETGEGTPVENLQEAEKTVKVRRPKKEKKK